MSSLLICTVLVALSAAGIVPIVRQIPYIQDQMFAGVRPWVCDLCMSFWSTALSTVFWWLYTESNLVCAVPAFALTFFIVRKNGDPLHGAPTISELDLDGRPPGSPDLPELEDIDGKA